MSNIGGITEIATQAISSLGSGARSLSQAAHANIGNAFAAAASFLRGGAPPTHEASREVPHEPAAEESTGTTTPPPDYQSRRPSVMSDAPADTSRSPEGGGELHQTLHNMAGQMADLHSQMSSHAPQMENLHSTMNNLADRMGQLHEQVQNVSNFGELPMAQEHPAFGGNFKGVNDTLGRMENMLSSLTSMTQGAQTMAQGANSLLGGHGGGGGGNIGGGALASAGANNGNMWNTVDQTGQNMNEQLQMQAKMTNMNNQFNWINNALQSIQAAASKAASGSKLQ